MSTHNIIVPSGTSKRLRTGGKYCDRDIVVSAVGGEGGEGGVVDTCTVILDVSSQRYWHPNDKVRVFYTAYVNEVRAEFIETDATTSPQIILPCVVCGSAIYVYTEVFAFERPSDCALSTDEYHHCIICPSEPEQTITIELCEAS